MTHSPDHAERAREVLSAHGIEIMGSSIAYRGNVLMGEAIPLAMLEYADERLRATLNDEGKGVGE